MVRITGSNLDGFELFSQGAVEVGVFGGNSDALRESVREYSDSGGRASDRSPVQS